MKTFIRRKVSEKNQNSISTVAQQLKVSLCIPKFYKFSLESLAPRGLKWVYLSKITTMALTFSDRTRWRHFLRWRNAFSARDVRRTITNYGIFSASISCI